MSAEDIDNDLFKAPLGTRFYVHNGGWYGRVGGTQDARTIFVEATGRTHPLTEYRQIGLIMSFEGQEDFPL